MINPKNDGDALKGGMQSNEKPPMEVSASPWRRSGGGGSGNPRPTTAKSPPHSATLRARPVHSLAPEGGVSRLRTAGGGNAAIGKERPRRRADADQGDDGGATKGEGRPTQWLLLAPCGHAREQAQE